MCIHLLIHFHLSSSYKNKANWLQSPKEHTANQQIQTPDLLAKACGCLETNHIMYLSSALKSQGSNILFFSELFINSRENRKHKEKARLLQLPGCLEIFSGPDSRVATFTIYPVVLNVADLLTVMGHGHWISHMLCLKCPFLDSVLLLNRVLS